MSAIRGTIQNGGVILDAPANLPDGTRVTVDPMALTGGDQLPDDEDDSPEAIEKRLALMDRVRPWMTPEELAAWDKTRAEDKAFQLSQWEKWCNEAEGPWQ